MQETEDAHFIFRGTLLGVLGQPMPQDSYLQQVRVWELLWRARGGFDLCVSALHCCCSCAGLCLAACKSGLRLWGMLSPIPPDCYLQAPSTPAWRFWDLFTLC